MSESITHVFVSSKSDSPDTTLVSASEWNDGHVFGGGINGQVLIYDNTQPNNMRWTDNVQLVLDVQSIANPTVSPYVQALELNIVTNSPVSIFVIVSYVSITTVGAVTYSATLYINGGVSAADTISSGANITTVRPGSGPAGTQNIHVDLISTGNANFTGGFALLQVQTIGI